MRRVEIDDWACEELKERVAGLVDAVDYYGDFRITNKSFEVIHPRSTFLS